MIFQAASVPSMTPLCSLFLNRPKGTHFVTPSGRTYAAHHLRALTLRVNQLPTS